MIRSSRIALAVLIAALLIFGVALVAQAGGTKCHKYCPITGSTTTTTAPEVTTSTVEQTTTSTSIDTTTTFGETTTTGADSSSTTSIHPSTTAPPAPTQTVPTPPSTDPDPDVESTQLPFTGASTTGLILLASSLVAGGVSVLRRTRGIE